MKNTVKKSSALVMIALLLVVSACKKDKTSDIAPPAQPPQSTMEMNYSAFDNQNKTLWNYGVSTISVGIWSAIAGVTMAIPVAAYSESFKHPVTEVEANHWSWTYDVQVGVKYTAVLHARYDSGDIKWSMLLSQENGFQDFEWFTGVSKVDGTSGYWMLNQKVGDTPVNLLKVDWTKPAEGEGTIMYTNVKKDDNMNGSFINYGRLDNNADFDSFFTIKNTKDNNLMDIQWSSTTEAGRYNLNGNGWNCWDTKANGHNDITCSAGK